MKIIGWNCQGLGSPSTVRALYNLLKTNQPEIVFIMESKSKLAAVEKVKRKDGFQNCCTVEPNGSSRGLVLFWKDNVTIKVLFADKNYFDVEVGDSQKCHHDGEVFRDFIQTCGFMDMGYNGAAYTWNNRRGGSSNIRIRLDRVLCNSAWLQDFENASVFIKSTISSNHCPILLDTDGGICRGKRPFRFESMWTLHEDFKNVEVFGNIQENIKALKTQLEHLQSMPRSAYSQSKESEIQRSLDLELQKEEELWRQKSRVDWLKGGDKNTAFFHVTTLKRRHRNKILKIKSSSGEWSSSEREVSDILCNHFQSLYSSEPLNNIALNFVLDAVQPVGAPENADQFRPISLCNITFKIITKVIVDRLKGALDSIISPSQSAFIPNRLISDNVLVAHELFHFIKKKKKGKENFLALKLDMGKAYDRLEWKFIDGMLRKLGFSNYWVDLVMTCITSVSYNLLINGCVKGAALTAVINQAEGAGLLRGEVNTLKECLDFYCEATGQTINFQKSSLTFNPNTHDRIKRWFARKLKVRQGDGPSKYLGLPTHFSVSKKDVFNEVKERTLNKVQTWTEKLLSHAGKELNWGVCLLGAGEVLFRDVLLEGLVWKVGDGKKITIWNDKWIPFLPNFKLSISKPDGCSIAMVSDLIDSSSRCWKMGLIRDIFNPFEASEILKIPLSLLPREDRRVWGATANGVFSVKLAYGLLVRREEENHKALASSSRVRRWECIPDSVWKRLWSIDTLPKIKSFLWRSCNEALAMGENLVSGKIHIDPCCLRCGSAVESIDHLLFECTFARSVWFGSPLQFSPPTDVPCLVDWIQSWDVWFREDKRVAKIALSRASFLCWYLWRARNELVFSGKAWSPADIIQLAENAFIEFADANKSVAPSSLGGAYNSVSLNQLWELPPAGFLKVNCDATSSASKNFGGLGVILRNHCGSALLARSIPTHFGSIIQGEILAIRNGVSAALEMGIENVMVESDNKEAIDFIKGTKIPAVEVEDLVRDILWLSEKFSSVSFSHIPRTMNSVSDALARKALLYPVVKFSEDIVFGDPLKHPLPAIRNKPAFPENRSEAPKRK
ncbi:uncharacterized protein LOC122672566 [Telopea speciosissima]|uniref:uncharacterized protein LOC122672566 n=1 Tax=Telopea speciosissima TaxID=54955 RepID=UPI001CC3440B|nr:uncharacterized protein LOC122672566 [Telopea speciosissima]